jgi:hypothetical protein
VDGDGGFHIGVVNKAVDVLVLEREGGREGGGGVTDMCRSGNVKRKVQWPSNIWRPSVSGCRPYLCHAGQNNEAELGVEHIVLRCGKKMDET